MHLPLFPVNREQYVAIMDALEKKPDIYPESQDGHSRVYMFRAVNLENQIVAMVVYSGYKPNRLAFYFATRLACNEAGITLKGDNNVQTQQ